MPIVSWKRQPLQRDRGPVSCDADDRRRGHRAAGAGDPHGPQEEIGCCCSGRRAAPRQLAPLPRSPRKGRSTRRPARRAGAASSCAGRNAAGWLARRRPSDGSARRAGGEALAGRGRRAAADDMLGSGRLVSSARTRGGTSSLRRVARELIGRAHEELVLLRDVGLVRRRRDRAGESGVALARWRMGRGCRGCDEEVLGELGA